MTGMLASVTDDLECEMAIAAGVDIIDLKDPANGALGALPSDRISSIVSRLAGRRPVSATLGDLPADPVLLRQAIQRCAGSGVDYVKIGVFSIEHIDACLEAAVHSSKDVALIAVLFADRAPPLDTLPEFRAAGFTGIMLDTADKLGGGLLENLGPRRIRQFIDQARSHGLLCGLAGSLKLRDIPQLLPLAPDYLGFRGALCRGRQRRQRLDPANLEAVRLLIGDMRSDKPRCSRAYDTDCRRDATCGPVAVISLDKPPEPGGWTTVRWLLPPA